MGKSMCDPLSTDPLIEWAESLAVQDSALAISIARDNPGPITWITDNSYMPPLRAFGHAENVWREDYEQGFEGAWEAYVDTFEGALDIARVYLGCPDYDNALYVVDLTRWQWADNDNADDLNDEWEAIE